MRPTPVGEKSDVSIGWKTIGSRYAKPQAGRESPLPLGQQPLDCFREATDVVDDRNDTRDEEKREEEEEKEKVVEL